MLGKAFASSQFYNPGLHPTKEDQVKLAQQISSSLSDVSNKKSKGQTMYLNRKQRSVKWVHEGQGKAKVDEREYYETSHQNNMGEVQREFSHNKQSYTVPATNFNGIVQLLIILLIMFLIYSIISLHRCNAFW